MGVSGYEWVCVSVIKYFNTLLVVGARSSLPTDNEGAPESTKPNVLVASIKVSSVLHAH